LHDDDDATDDALHSGSSIWHAPADLARDPGSMSLGTFLLQGHTVVAITNNFAPCMSFSVLVCPSVLTMSFPAPCADSVHLPGMLTCHAVLLSLLKKSGKVFVTLFPRFPLPWPAPLRCRVFDVIKIAMSLMVYFLQRWFHHRWQNHGTIFLTKIEPESPRSSAGILRLNTPAVPHQIQTIISKNCSQGAVWASFNMVIQMDGHGQQWQGSLSSNGPSLTLIF
jgi:hypothetical protein